TRSYGDWSSDVCSSDLRTASRARRRKFATLTPGMDIGYWKARKRRMRARRSGEYSRIFSPLNQISPSVTSYLGLPIMTFARVLRSEERRVGKEFRTVLG